MSLINRGAEPFQKGEGQPPLALTPFDAHS